MKRPIHLPLTYEFFELFDNYEIKNWQAKQFWKNLNISSDEKNKNTKSLMYSGLKILTKIGFLEVNYEISKRNSFSYTETVPLSEFRNQRKKEKLEIFFSKKKSECIYQIEDKKNNIAFLESLLSEDKILNQYFLKYQNDLKNDVEKIKSNLKLMERILTSEI